MKAPEIHDLCNQKKKCYELDSFDFGRMLELVFTFCLGKINRVVGAEKYMWSFGLLISLCVSMLLLIRVTKALPVGTAYAIWTGIGAAGTVLIGIFFFKEPASWGRIFFIFTLICSIVGLKLVSH